MEQNITPTPIAGGSLGWGGLINKGERFIPSHCSSDCLNVYEQNGVLKKRQGYTKTAGSYILCGAVTTETGSYSWADGSTRIAQNVLTSGAGTGGDVAYTGGSNQNIIVGVKLGISGTVETPGTLKMELWPNVAGLPVDEAFGTNNYFYTTGDITATWMYFLFKNITVPSGDFFIVLTSTAGTNKVVYYSNAYTAGGKAYVDTGSWGEISGKFLDFKIWFLDSTTSYLNKYISKFNRRINNFFNGYAAVTNGRNSFTPTSFSGENIQNLKDLYVIFEGDTDIYRIQFVPNGSNTYIGIFPYYQGTTGNKNFIAFSCDSTLLSICDITKTYLAENDGGYIKRIGSYTGNSKARTADIPSGGTAIALVPISYITGTFTPLIWGSTAAPYSGAPASYTFTGLTNPITQATVVMSHGARMWWGNVVINSVAYGNRNYYSGIGTPEAGYTDNGHIDTDGNTTAYLDVGDYAIFADKQYTYCFLGGKGTSAEFELVKHDLVGGVESQEAICIYKDKTGSAKIYGVSNYGFFEIDRTSKVFIHGNIDNEIISDVPSLTYCYPDYKREVVVFSYKYGSTRYSYAYSVKNKTWWPEDTNPDMAISVNEGTFTPKIYGIYSNELWTMNTGNMDDGDFITAYYKCGPAFASNDNELVLHRTWLKARNEPTVSHLDVKFSNNYGTENTESIALRKSTFADNVPVVRQVNTYGSGNSTEIKLYQAKITTTVNVNSNSGQAVLSVASVTGFIVGHKIIINDGGVREETGVISSIGTSSITLSGNLTYTHTAAQADAVDTYDESFAVSSISLDVEGRPMIDQSFA